MACGKINMVLGLGDVGFDAIPNADHGIADYAAAEEAICD